MPQAIHSPQPVRDAAERYRTATARRRQADRDHLVRVIASDPNYLGWLYDHNAALLEAEAHRATDRDQHVVATMLRERAAQHRRQAVAPW